MKKRVCMSIKKAFQHVIIQGRPIVMSVTVTATFTNANEIAGTPRIAIDYAGDGSDVPSTNMTEGNNIDKSYLYFLNYR